MTRLLEIALEVRKNEFDVDIYEPETGDFVSATFTNDDKYSDMDRFVGNEIRSWISLMKDEMDDESVVL